MSFLTLRKTSHSTQRIDLFGIIPNRVNNLPLNEISHLPIRIGERAGLVGDCFEVVDGDRTAIALEGDLTNCDYIGGGLESGRIVANGNVGDFLADRMRGGTVEVVGSAHRFACSGLRGGLVTISGDCGEYAAAAAPGEKRGMNGGTLVVKGNCDQWLATRMRRGTVIVHGNVAAACANRMIAGTLVLCGQVTFPLAANMARGTILLLGHQAACVSPAGFTAPELTELSYLQILLNDIAPHLPVPKPAASSRAATNRAPVSRVTALRAPVLRAPVLRALGDRVNRGLGEIIWLNSQLIATDPYYAHS